MRTGEHGRLEGPVAVCCCPPPSRDACERARLAHGRVRLAANVYLSATMESRDVRTRALHKARFAMTEPALSSSSVHVSRVGMRHAVLGKSGLASPDALIAGAVSALRAPAARATGSFMVAPGGRSTSDPLDELTKLLAEAFGVWDDIAGDSANTPVRHPVELVPKSTSDAPADVLPCASRSPTTSPTVTSSTTKSLDFSTPIPSCRKNAEAASSTSSWSDPKLFAAASRPILLTAAAYPAMSRASVLKQGGSLMESCAILASRLERVFSDGSQSTELHCVTRQRSSSRSATSFAP